MSADWCTIFRGPDQTNAHVERFIQTTESELWMIEGTEPTVDKMIKGLQFPQTLSVFKLQDSR